DANARPCALLSLARDELGWFARLPEVRRLPSDLVLRLDLPAEALELHLVLGGEERRVAITAEASAARLE
ncbi:MAG: hypothetical protein JNM84_16815, partial [Planctomycetes bacterium]|nr:hypothetical protein [Planctomycetota bacterium]